LHLELYSYVRYHVHCSLYIVTTHKGKSTLIGTLTTSQLDDGRGKSRTAIMKHRHELESGRTSTATTHLMGFRSSGEPIAGRDTVRAPLKRKSEDEVARESYRVITLMDLAGHEKYLKTTIHGVSSGFADHSLILVNARQPPTHMTQHHLNLCCSFGIPVIVVFTKMDGCPEHALKTCRDEVTKMLRSPEIKRRPFIVRNESDIDTVLDKLHILAPMLETSCVTGEGIDLLQKLLFRLPKRRRHETKVHRSFEFLVEDIFNVPGVGAVVSGFVNAGELTVGSACHVFVGPTDDGTFVKTVAKSAHISRINTSHITAGQSACLALALNKEMRKKLRRGMVVLQENPTSTRHFDAEICVLKGEGTTIRRSYQAYIHVLNVRQSAYARHIEIVNQHVVSAPPKHHQHIHHHPEDDGIVLRPGSRAKVSFEFAQRPEYIRPGMRMLFRDGRVRGVGIITGIPGETSVS
jgi:elongation factor 1-alpha